MRMDQRMKLAPRMIQSMEILQMTMQALEARIEQELVSNPTLELREPGSEDYDVDAAIKEEQRDAREGERELTVKDDSVDANHADDFERLNNISDEYGDAWNDNVFDGYDRARPARQTGERDGKMDAMLNTAARPASLGDQLLDQWHLLETNDDVRAAGEYLIGFLDDDGYLRVDRDALLDQAPPGVDGDLLDKALSLIQQTLEPVGVGARDLRECLLLQIDARTASDRDEAEHHHGNGDHDPPRDWSTERLLVSEYLKDIEANRIPKIAQSTGLSIDQIKDAIYNLRQFHPHPCRQLVEDSPQTIRPDAIIEFDEENDEYTARLTDDRLPNLQVNHEYAKMAKDAAVDKRTRDFVSTNIRNGRWLIDAIQQRSHTLLRVISVVLEAQREFFDQGEQHLKPLPMTTVADQLGIHVATVSRAVADKYLMTPRGVYPLRMFFSGGTETEAGEAMSWTAVQAKLKEIIDAEDKADPYNDDQLVEELKKHGIEIARRTVAKYRKQLHIAPARQRREY